MFWILFIIIGLVIYSILYVGKKADRQGEIDGIKLIQEMRTKEDK